MSYAAAQAFVASDQISSERFDDETVLISVEKGLYYSLKGSASDIWDMFKEPRTIAQVVAAFGVQPAQANAIKATIDDFLENGLIEAATQSAVASQILVTAFTQPDFEVHSDLAVLIAIDPVHEVDENAGWPKRPDGYPSLA